MRIKIPLHLAHSLLDKLLQEGLKVSGKDFFKNTLPAQEWVKKIEGEITEIFEDAEPVYRLSHLSMKPKGVTNPVTNPLAELSHSFDELRHKMSVLAELYREVEQRMVTPLEYVDSMLCLRYHDLVCPLQSTSIQRSLCIYMFNNFDFGQLVDIDVVTNNVLLNSDKESSTEPSKSDIKRIKGAVKEINRKTIEAFGFPIFNYPQGLIGLRNPLPPNSAQAQKNS